MDVLEQSPAIKDNNPCRIGKWLWLIAVTSSLSFGIGEPKKHRRLPPPPSKEAAGASNKVEPIIEGHKARPKDSKGAYDGNAGSVSSAKNGSSTRNLKTKPKLSNKPSAECTEKFSIETFMQISSATSPQASKSGGIYFLSDLREVPQLYSLEAPGTWPEQLTFFPDGVSYYRVSPDGNKILIATDVGGDEQYDLHLMQVKTKKISPLIVNRKKRIESLHWAPNSNWFAFTSTERNLKDLDLYRYDLGTEKALLLASLEGSHSVSDISPDGNLIALEEFRSVTDADILIYNQKEKKALNLTPHLKAYSNKARFSSNGKTLFFVSDFTGGLLQLYTMEIATPSKTSQLTSGTWGIEHLVLNRDRNALYYSVNEEGYSRLYGFELGANGQKKENLSLPELENEVLEDLVPSETRGKESLFITKSTSTRPNDVWLATKGTMTQWTKSLPSAMNPECFSSEKLVHYPSFDKLDIPAFVYLPRGSSFESPSAIPFIVSIHGGPEAQYRPVFNKRTQYFLQSGFGIFAPNIRGSFGYGREYTLKDNYKKRMDSIQDIVEGAHWILKNQWTKKELLAINGGSYGGFAVLRTIEVEPSLFAVASESVGIANFVTFLENTKPYRRALREIEYGPLSDTEFLKSISPLEYVDQIKTPLLVFHGANDPRVPVGEAEQIVEALKKREIPVDLTVFKDEGHGNKKLSNILQQAKQMAYFFEKYTTRK